MVILIISLIGGLAEWTSTVQLQVSDYSQQSNYIVWLQAYRMISE